MGIDALYHPHFEPDLGTLRRTLLVTDTVHSIVPSNADYKPSPGVSRHLQSLPETFLPTPPAADDVNIVKEYYALNALRQSFSQISKRRRPIVRGRLNITDLDKSFEIDGYASIHEGKVGYTVYQMLEEYGLIREETRGDYFLVDRAAVGLILSFIAQRMSHRLAMRTVTDVESSFLLSTACDAVDSLKLNQESLFASAILRIHVPAEIGRLSFKTYAELRRRYAELRTAFPTYIGDLSEIYRLNGPRASKDMVSIIGKIANSIEAQELEIRQSRIGNTVKHWTPIGISSILSVCGLFAPPGSGGQWAAALGTVAVNIFGGIFGEKTPRGDFQGVRSLFLNAKGDIVRAYRLEKYLPQVR